MPSVGQNAAVFVDNDTIWCIYPYTNTIIQSEGSRGVRVSMYQHIV
jgi:hypothetical protein